MDERLEGGSSRGLTGLLVDVLHCRSREEEACRGRAKEKSLPHAAPPEVAQAHLKPHIPSSLRGPPLPRAVVPTASRSSSAGHGCVTAASLHPRHRYVVRGFFSQTAKCKPYYFWISKTIINT